MFFILEAGQVVLSRILQCKHLPDYIRENINFRLLEPKEILFAEGG